MSVRMVVRSTECTEIFPQNKPFDFRIQVNKGLKFDGDWTIDLTEIGIDSVTRRAQNEIFVYADICDMSYINQSQTPLLRRIYITDTGSMVFKNPYPIPLRCKDFECIHFWILDKNSKPATFLLNETVLSLVFRKKE